MNDNRLPEAVVENLYTPDCIRTFTGVYVNILSPTAEMIRIEDIAHALSMQPRFGGHLPVFYSVAQHSIAVSGIVGRDDKLAALLHDASEAYLMDIPSPIKKHLSNYHEIEERFMKLISAKFGFEYPLNDAVKAADKELLELEWSQLMLEGEDEFRPYTQEQAEDRFRTFFDKYK